MWRGEEGGRAHSLQHRARATERQRHGKTETRKDETRRQRLRLRHRHRYALKARATATVHFHPQLQLVVALLCAQLLYSLHASLGDYEARVKVWHTAGAGASSAEEVTGGLCSAKGRPQ